MKRIDKFLVAAAIVGCSALVIAMGLASVQAPPAFSKGDWVDVTPVPAHPRSTLAILLSSSCSACRRLAPALQRISEGQHPFGIVVVGNETRDSLATFAFEHGIASDRISGALPWIDPVKSPSLITPTVVLLNERQRVVKAWAGYASIHAEEKAIIEMATRQASQGG
jgi:hypothetical protein